MFPVYHRFVLTICEFLPSLFVVPLHHNNQNRGNYEDLLGFTAGYFF